MNDRQPTSDHKRETDPADIYRHHQLYETLLKEVDHRQPEAIHLQGLTGSSASLLSGTLFNDSGSRFLAILPGKDDAAYFYNDLLSVAGEESVLFFPSGYKRSARYNQTDPANIVLRTNVLSRLASGQERSFIVTYPEGIMEKVISKRNLKKNTLKIKRGDDLSPEFIEEVLQEYGFIRTDFVSEPGQYAVRGSITDLFSFSTDKPFRLDFFGNTVESIRIFNPDDQLSEKIVNEINVIPNIQDVTIEEVKDSLFDFIPDSTVIWIHSPEYCRDRINEIYFGAIAGGQEEENKDIQASLLTGNRVFEEALRFRHFMIGKSISMPAAKSYSFNTEPQPNFSKNFTLLGDRLSQNTEKGYSNCIVSENEAQIERLRNIFSEIDPSVVFNALLFNLHGGFIDHDLKTALFTDHQIFDRYHRFRIRGYFTRKESISLREITGLNPGDYVVHTDHGIGRFGGLEKIEVNNRIQEAIKLVYRDNDTLYVGIHSLHRISKYKGRDAQEPRIHKLGSGAWQKLKQETKRKVKDIARDLIRIYASRMTMPGNPFSSDSYLQRELEASFIYEDTPDQLSATELVKKDMESKHPMDRLVCGDVGFGKTEVAVRAAFKAATDGMQTAVLVPTTILALQHYRTFQSRLEGFPCRVDYISRHRKPADQKKIVAGLADGSIDVIIGTHRMVGKDIRFKNLGLLIVDEEQRFGVAVKEKIKKMKTNVDTLTLSATPIPRTLQFSLIGARDMSIINTPPPNRVPIVTELHGFNEEIIREGIEYEVNRNGQVFFIHNRVDSIRVMQGTLERICPGVKTAVVHGKMPGQQTEEIMSGFIQGDYDVLLATTIIESGLDIPNANTIFINEAHHFGLSELHQLRGRVGRSNRKAFCYLLIPPLTSLSHDARRRVLAIEEFSGLGSGFSIALQDLDIRGAGNLLGGEQSGFIADIGFEAYQKILQEAATELREEEGIMATEEGEAEKQFLPESKISDIQIDTDMEIMFPDDYVSNIPERIRLYRELNEIKNEKELEEFELRLKDRFGPIPPEANALINVARLKWIASELGMEKISLKGKIMIVTFDSDPDSPFYRSTKFASLMNYVNRRQGQMRVRQKETRLTLSVTGINTVNAAHKILTEMSETL
ncbi:MAG: transcription-repair coupling factor [Bacteroidales bacterium]